MHQIRKTTLKNNTLVPFAQFAASSQAAIGDPAAISNFTDSVKRELQTATSTDNFVYGHRTGRRKRVTTHYIHNQWWPFSSPRLPLAAAS